MGYFVTGATGFIGRNLVELLLEREGTIYVLVREGSRGRLEELISRWGADEGRIVPVVGDLSQRRLGVSDAQIEDLTGKIDHFFHLAAIYDMKADANSQRVANVEGTRHAVQLSDAIEAGRFHMFSSIAAAGLYPGTWREDMFDEAVDVNNHPYFQTKHESERVVRQSSKQPWRVYRPGIVVGNSETGEMDKIDGPYYFFKLIRRIRQAVPSWAPMPGVSGREINIVPVDFVVKAVDHIAHLDGLDGRAFSLTDPNPLSAGEVIDTFAKAAHAPEATIKAPPELTESLEPLLGLGLSALPFANTIADSVLADFGIPREVLIYLHYPTHFDSRNTQAALDGTGISVPPLGSYADKLWDYWARHLDPDLYRDRTLLGAMRGRAGLVGGLSQIIEQQIPDELMRAGKKALGTATLSKNVNGKIVMVTGASSGIGKSTAMKIAEAGGIVLLVARTPSKLEETKEAIEKGGGEAHVHPCDLSDMEDIDRMCEEALAQHGYVDVLINNAGRSIRRSIALSYDRFHDFERTMQLNYFGPVRTILRLLPTMRERRSGQIINVSSIGVQTNMPRFSAYVASKSALDAFSRCIASEIVDDGVKITTIHMPLVRTPMIAPTKMYDKFPTITPDEAAEMLTDAIVYQPKRIATPVGTMGQILYAINPKSMDYILNSAYHMFPDSTAAKKGKKPAASAGSSAEGSDPPPPPQVFPEDEQATARQILFANLMRGVHW